MDKKPDYVYFHDGHGASHSAGKIIFGWNSGDYYQPPEEEHVLDLDEIEAVLTYIKNSFSPDGWEIINGEVVEVKWNS